MTAQDDYLLINRTTKRAVEFVGDTIRYCKATPNFQRCLPVWPDYLPFSNAEEREAAAQQWMAEGMATFPVVEAA